MNSQSATRVNHHGWEAIRLENSYLSALVVPEIGGRLMEFRLGSQQFLFVNRDLLGKRFTFEEHQGDGSIRLWKNYGGSKTWPAPQGWDNDQQWHGPPDPILDGGGYTHDFAPSSSDARMAMTSPPDPRTGLRIHRTLSLTPNTSRLHMQRKFENITDHPIQWSIWEVAQIDCSSQHGGFNPDCWVYAPVGDQPYHVMFGDDNIQYQRGVRPGVMGVHFQGIVGKIGIHNRRGWLAFADQQSGYALCFIFPYDPTAQYPDGGAVTEVWTESPRSPSPVPIDSPGYLLEAEVLTPLFTIQPGESVEYTMQWCAAYCPGPIVDVNQLGCIHEPLRLQMVNSWARINGVFGCFMEGQARLVWLDDASRIIESIVLDRVTPLAALHINRVIPRPPNAVRLRVEIVDYRTEILLGVLDETVL
jgi:hypothetical protein